MLKKMEHMTYYELLEVDAKASKQEIHKAYERIRRVYEPNSIALYSLFTPEETAMMHQRIEEAYRTLVYEDNRKRYDELLQKRGSDDDIDPLPTIEPRPLQPSLTLPSENRYMASAKTPPPAAPQPSPDALSQEKIRQASQMIAEFTGPAIRLFREQRGLTLRYIADTTKISIRFLEAIETETFNKLPARAYIRGFITLYAKILGCDPERMSSDYLKRYDAAVTQKLK